MVEGKRIIHYSLEEDKQILMQVLSIKNLIDRLFDFGPQAIGQAVSARDMVHLLQETLLLIRSVFHENGPIFSRPKNNPELIVSPDENPMGTSKVQFVGIKTGEHEPEETPKETLRMAGINPEFLKDIRRRKVRTSHQSETNDIRTDHPKIITNPRQFVPFLDEIYGLLDLFKDFLNSDANKLKQAYVREVLAGISDADLFKLRGHAGPGIPGKPKGKSDKNTRKTGYFNRVIRRR